MRRIIVVSLLLLSFTTTFAQLNITSEEMKISTIGAIRVSYANLQMSITGQDTTIYISARSSNQFDDPYIFDLGKSPKSALATANDLMELCDKMDNRGNITVKDAGGKEFIIMKASMLGAPYLDFKGRGYAGTMNITKKEFDKCKQLIQSNFKIK